MTLAETCDELERGLVRRERYFRHEAGSYNARFEIAALLKLLVLHGNLQIASVDHTLGEAERFAGLEKQVEALP